MTSPQLTAPTTTSSSHPSLPLNDGKFHLLLAASGSVATIKMPLIVEKLYRIYEPSRISIQIVVTASANRFLPAADSPLPASIKIWQDADEWANWTGRTDPIVHIELRRWAHLLVVAPLSANSLAKIAGGFSDNLLMSVIRAWNPAVPILLAPAMNTYMYTHPLTKHHLQTIKDHMEWITVLKPVEKVLACGDIGMGGMREWSDIVEIIVSRFPPGGYPVQHEPVVDGNGLVHEPNNRVLLNRNLSRTPSRNHTPDHHIGDGHIRFQDEVSDTESQPQPVTRGRQRSESILKQHQEVH
ncbi:flavoprotein [Lipomyces arxii]|uniref:flavoprotein n=1 Tax=Lipomyces arxii TaxID=56418 RepID=UPI0034CD1532